MVRTILSPVDISVSMTDQHVKRCMKFGHTKHVEYVNCRHLRSQLSSEVDQSLGGQPRSYYPHVGYFQSLGANVAFFALR